MRGHKIKVEDKKLGIIYTVNTPFIEYLVDLRKIDICPEARSYYENAYLEHPEYNLGQIIDNYPLKQGWATSMLQVYDGQLSKDIKSKYFNFITDDVINHILWRDLNNLTGIERKMLREKFKGKLPNIERHINDNN